MIALKEIWHGGSPICIKMMSLALIDTDLTVIIFFNMLTNLSPKIDSQK